MEKLKKTEELRSSQPDIKVGDEYRDKFFKEEKLSIIEKINMKLGKNRTIVKICNKLKIEPIYLALIFIVPILILLLTFFSFTTRMITTLYPLYMSFKTLQYEVNKSKKDGKLYKQEDEDNDTTQWLSYWLLYSFVMNSELLLGSLVDSIPLYKFLKFLFLLSCFLPQIKLSVPAEASSSTAKAKRSSWLTTDSHPTSRMPAPTVKATPHVWWWTFLSLSTAATTPTITS